MDFIAIDFETANEKRCSPCSIGITVVKNNKIVEKKYWMIKPKELRFEPMNIWVHGIKPEDVANEKEFNEIWQELLPYFENNLVLAHNASFDISVLRNTLDLYDIPYPNFNYCCTMIMSKNFFDYLDNAKLNTVSNHLGYKFSHHHASEDASACANILLKIQEELDVDSIDEILDLIGIKIGKMFDKGYSPCSSICKKLTSSRQKNLVYTSHTDKFNSSTSYFRDKVVVFTGPLSSMTRIQATGIIHQLGGRVGSSVTKKTNVLVTGFKNIQSLNLSQMSTKLRKAFDLECNGQNIDFINEDEFLNIIYDN